MKVTAHHSSHEKEGLIPCKKLEGRDLKEMMNERKMNLLIEYTCCLFYIHVPTEQLTSNCKPKDVTVQTTNYRNLVN